jgi:hypothetical protein
MKWAEDVVVLEAKRNVHRVSMANPEVKNPLGRPTCRREDNIRCILNTRTYDGMS